MCHVLIIEDDWFIAEHIEEVARDGGATSVDRAETEADAICAAVANPPSVILSDVQLAEGTGPAAVWEIRSRLGPCPVIFITATPEACEPCDYAAAILRKPIAPPEVIRIFQTVAPV
jgi:two-component system, response regulator PdtaR